ncbi:MAG TPA: preprotein translocase subunit YajC [Gaiellaceae bacterium]|nr:preprotein translocase subunit YajC [Gaiellaceae bacterium]
MNAGAFWLFVLATLGIIYFLMIRPQRQQQRRHQEMLSALKPGDEVITAGGIYGEVKRLDADRVALEIDDDVEVVVAKRAIASVVPPEEVQEENEEEGETAPAEEPSQRA